MASNKVAFTIRLREELYERLILISGTESRSLNNTIELLLSQSADNYEKKRNNSKNNHELLKK